MQINESIQTPEKEQGKIYHAFISHQSDCKPWVRILAENLKAQGFNVFLDEWALQPGKNWIDELYHGLKQSRKGILVVTPEIMDSGWVTREYHQMMLQVNEEPGFEIIPLVFGEDVPDFPFLKSIQWIDFRDPGKYRHAFYRLVCALEGRQPEPEPVLKGKIQVPQEIKKESLPPGKDEISFVEELFQLLFKKQAVVLLTRGNRRQTVVKKLILEKAKSLFGEKNVLHLAPAYSEKPGMEEYFSLLAKQCGFASVQNSAASFQAEFEELLVNDREVFLLISRFEHSGAQGQEELAAVLRGLNERFPRNLRILICGGQRLHELVYTGTLSYLKGIEIKELPEITISDIIRAANSEEISLCRGKEMNIDDKTAKKLLQFSGGHPRILEICFDLYSRNLDFTQEDLVREMVYSPFLWQLFIPFRQDTETRKRVCELLKKKDVGAYQPYLYDPVLKQLYWKNLLKRNETGDHLIWRCDALCLTGQRIMA